MQTDNPPLSKPVCVVRPRVSAFAEGGCATPLAVYRRLRAARPDAGLCLFESADRTSETSRRSIVAAASAVRLDVRGDTARFTPLSPAAGPLVQSLAGRVPGARFEGEVLVGDYPSHRVVSGADDERLRSAGVLDAVRTLAAAVADAPDAAAPLPAGAFGAMGYEIVDAFEELPSRGVDPLDEPDATFVLVLDAVVFDRETATVSVISRPLPEEEPAAVAARHAGYEAVLQDQESPAGRSVPPRAAPLPRATDVSDDVFCAGVARLQSEIQRGEIFQGVLSRGFTCRSAAASVDVYEELTRHNPSPYMFHLDLSEGSLFGSSPETYLRVQAGRIEIRPIAGTIARGFTPAGTIDPDTDERLALQLLLDPKEQAEHAMLLDLARNDVARVAKPGSMEVVQQMAIEKYRHVQHLVSRVCGQLRAGFDALHAYRAAANMGTLTGAPKLRAMELIREIEPTARGFYGGAAGYLLQDGSFDSCIVIRSMRQVGDAYHVRAGAGIVADSDPERELAETEIKARACLESLARVDAATRERRELAS